MANTKKSFSDLIGASFNSIGALKDETAVAEEPEVEQQSEIVDTSAPAAAGIPADELKPAEKSFEDITSPYKEGFYIIRKRGDDDIIAVGLEKKLNEDEDYILKNIKSTNAFKNEEIDYTLLPQNCIDIFRKEWARGELQVYNTKDGLDAIVNLDSKPVDDIDAMLKKEGFVRDIEQFGECRKTSVVLPVKFIRYCTKRGEGYKIWKGSGRWFLTNLVYKDISLHSNEIDIDEI